jgi:hypothetical protein
MVLVLISPPSTRSLRFVCSLQGQLNYFWIVEKKNLEVRFRAGGREGEAPWRKWPRGACGSPTPLAPFIYCLQDKKADLRNKERELQDLEERHSVEIKVCAAPPNSDLARAAHRCYMLHVARHVLCCALTHPGL